MESKIDKIIKLEEKLENYSGEDKIISSHELRDILAKQTNPTSFVTGLNAVDRILGNVEAGELIVVSGPTGHGKTTFLSTITVNTAKTIKSVWFCFEGTQRQFIEKFGNDLPLFYTPQRNSDNNIQWLIERIIEAKVKFNVDMVFIDHLSFIISMDKFNGKNLSLEIGDIVTKIKQIAMDYGLVIWMVAHSTDDKTRTTREPKMMDIRDSGMISRLADVVMGVWRIPNSDNGKSGVITDEFEDTDNRAKVRIWKNRRMGRLSWFLMENKNHLMYELDVNNPANFTPEQNKAKELDLEYERA